MKNYSVIDPAIETALRIRSLLDAGVPAQTILSKVSAELGVGIPALQKLFYSYTKQQLTSPRSETPRSQKTLIVKPLPKVQFLLKERDFEVLLNHNGYATYLLFANACLQAPVHLTRPELGYLPTPDWENFLSHVARYYPHINRKNAGRINKHDQKQLPSDSMLRRTAWQYNQPRAPQMPRHAKAEALILAAE